MEEVNHDRIPAASPFFNSLLGFLSLSPLFSLWRVIFIILDLDRPNVGFITISQQPMIDTVAGLSFLTTNIVSRGIGRPS